MRWLKRKIQNWLNSDDCLIAVETPIRRGPSIDVEGVTFNVMPAIGGVLVQTRQYDSRTDRHTYNTHIITDDEPLADRIGQIVALEILRHG